MPYVEILGPPSPPEAKAALTSAVTDAVTSTFDVGPDTVTIYFLSIAAADYAHAGQYGGGPGQRVFVKVHAFRRNVGKRRILAAALTSAVAGALPANPDTIAVYFLDRDPDEVAHAGRLASD